MGQRIQPPRRAFKPRELDELERLAKALWALDELGIFSQCPETLEGFEDIDIKQDFKAYYAEELERIQQFREQPKMRFLKAVWSEVRSLWSEAADADGWASGNGLSW